ncbi:hypothetical protein [Octadecabacter ascidiaceicola]|uniref:Uncharacterized protein n=1 Tax=Octadecabacter ascidiaceicola TaxID=1655543 RepID=A0A238KPG7_9RHOB|nr:hypothetical protein [Octadecabacter ascidiaceicola]SMX44540.1 hypothetical protein OCA8868_03169 [Octadecabacter ascidiaceicola]
MTTLQLTEMQRKLLEILDLALPNFRLKLNVTCIRLVTCFIAYAGAAHSDSIGGEGQGPLGFQSAFAEHSIVHPSGLIELRRDNAVGLTAHVASFWQWNVIEIPLDIVAVVDGLPATCVILTEKDAVSYGDCSFFLGSIEDGATSLLELIYIHDPALVECPDEQPGSDDQMTILNCTRGKRQ